MKDRWTPGRAWEWVRARPWLRGCNFMSSDCANRIDQWQEYGFEERLETADRELAAAAEIGFNTIRIIGDFTVWQKEHDSYMEHIDRYLDTASKHGITTMFTIANDCSLPKRLYREPEMGEQKYDVGYHGGRKVSQHGSLPGEVGWTVLDDPALHDEFLRMAQEIITAHRDDERICIWDLYNEAGNNNRSEICLPYLKELFSLAREIDPIQPLTADIWGGESGEVRDLILSLVDLVDFHYYGPYPDTVERAERLLRTTGRPVICSEWLNRCLGNDVAEIFPLFYALQIGCWCWGFVAGKYQTYEPWESLWKQVEAGRRDIDVSKWQHDLLRPSGRPYDPKEIDIIRRFSALADAGFAEEQTRGKKE